MSKQLTIKTEGDLLVELRERLKGKTHKQLAKELDLSEPLVQGVLKGKLPIGYKMAQRLGYGTQIQRVFVPLQIPQK